MKDITTKESSLQKEKSLLKDLVQHLKKGNLISSSAKSILKKTLEGVPLEMMNSHIK